MWSQHKYVLYLLLAMQLFLLHASFFFSLSLSLSLSLTLNKVVLSLQHSISHTLFRGGKKFPPSCLTHLSVNKSEFPEGKPGSFFLLVASHLENAKVDCLVVPRPIPVALHSEMREGRVSQATITYH